LRAARVSRRIFATEDDLQLLPFDFLPVLPKRTFQTSCIETRGLEIDLQVLDGIQRTGFALSLGEHRTSLFGC
jgi:hypothetical protein